MTSHRLVYKSVQSLACLEVANFLCGRLLACLEVANSLRVVLGCKLQYVITSEKGLVFTRNNLDLMICADNYYWFLRDIHNCVLQIQQYKGI